MKKLLLPFLLLLSHLVFSQQITGVRISDMTTYTGTADDGYVPIVINGVNRKILVRNMQAGKVDSAKVQGDSVFTYSGGTKKFAGKIHPTAAYNATQQLNDSTYLIKRNDGIVDTIQFSGSGGGAYTSITQISDSSFTMNRPNGTRDTIQILIEKPDYSNVFIQNQYEGPQSLANAWIEGRFRAGGLLTADSAFALKRNATSYSNAQNGWLYYNSTTDQFQGFRNGAWNNLLMLPDTSFLIRNQTASVQSGGFSVSGNSTIGNSSTSAGNNKKYIRFFTDYTNPEAILVSTSNNVGSAFVGVKVAPLVTNSGSITAFNAIIPTGYVSSNAIARGLLVSGTLGTGDSSSAAVTSSYIGVDINLTKMLTGVNGARDNYGIHSVVASANGNVYALYGEANATSSLATPYGLYVKTGKVNVQPLKPASGIKYLTINSSGDIDTTATSVGSVALTTTDNNLLISGSTISTKKTPLTLTDAATVTWDLSQGYNANVIIAGNRTLSITNPQAGSYYKLTIYQDATGGRTLTWPANVKWKGGIPPTLTATGGAHDVIMLYYNSNGNFDGVYGLDFK